MQAAGNGAEPATGSIVGAPLHDHIWTALAFLSLVPQGRRHGPGGMIGFLVRFLGLWLVAGGLVTLVIDAAKSIAASELVITQLGPAWYAINPASLIAAQQFIDARIGPWLWDPWITWTLVLPSWVVFGGLGFLLTYLGRRQYVDPEFA
jgi:hypothetical protein